MKICNLLQVSLSVGTFPKLGKIADAEYRMNQFPIGKFQGSET
jgi:hypothetical protein